MNSVLSINRSINVNKKTEIIFGILEVIDEASQCKIPAMRTEIISDVFSEAKVSACVDRSRLHAIFPLFHLLAGILLKIGRPDFPGFRKTFGPVGPL